MTECSRIADLLRRVLDGDPWYGLPLLRLIAGAGHRRQLLRHVARPRPTQRVPLRADRDVEEGARPAPRTPPGMNAPRNDLACDRVPR